MTREERKLLQELKVLGFTHIARDGDGTIFAYDLMPYYENTQFLSDGNNFLELSKVLFSFIKPKERRSIEELENE